MAEVLEVSDLRTLRTLRLTWQALWTDSPGGSFFHTYDWFENYWRHFGAGGRMRVLLVRAAGRPVGILPLVLQRRTYKLATVRVLGYPLDNWGTYFAPVGPNPTATLLPSLRHLAATARDWDQLELGWMAESACATGAVQRVMEHAGFAPREATDRTTSLIDLSRYDHLDGFLAERDRKVRHEVRRHCRRVSEWGAVELVRHRPLPRRAGDGDPQWGVYDECEEIASRSWQATSPNGNTLSHPRLSGFYRDSHAAAARLGLVDMAVLRLAGKPVAFWYGYHHQGHVTGLRMGYRHDCPVGGAGTVLLNGLIGDLIERGDHTLDLGPGPERYKQALRTHIESTRRLIHTPVAAWRPQLVRATSWLKSQVAAV